MRDLIPLPHKLGSYRGKNYSRYTVRVTQSGIGWEHHADFEIIAESPKAAVNAIQDELAPRMGRPTEFETVGPAGGKCHRFCGWESLVAYQMFACRPESGQLPLNLAQGGKSDAAETNPLTA
jgi:hypothetical protein